MPKTTWCADVSSEAKQHRCGNAPRERWSHAALGTVVLLVVVLCACLGSGDWRIELYFDDGELLMDVAKDGPFVLLSVKVYEHEIGHTGEGEAVARGFISSSRGSEMEQHTVVLSTEQFRTNVRTATWYRLRVGADNIEVDGYADRYFRIDDTADPTPQLIDYDDPAKYAIVLTADEAELPGL